MLIPKQRIDKDAEEKRFPYFKSRQGHWRTDFLLENSLGPNNHHDFKICEINARFPTHWIHLAACNHKALMDINSAQTCLRPAVEPRNMLKALFTVFDLELPIHILRRKDDSRFSNLISQITVCLEREIGIKPRIVDMEDLRLLPTTSSDSGYMLCCTCKDQSKKSIVDPLSIIGENGEALEQIHQVGLQLLQHDLLSLSPEMRYHLARHSVLDMRTILLVHDKRILGIILQELNDLTNKHRVITREEVEILRNGIIPTIIPGSLELDNLIRQSAECPNIKDNFVLKPVRDGQGKGILFGENLSTEKWNSMLLALRDPTLHVSQTQYIIQPYIE